MDVIRLLLGAAAAVPIALSVSVCNTSSGEHADPTGTRIEAPLCVDAGSIELGLEETCELGFSAAEILAESEGQFAGSMHWADETESTLNLRVGHNGGAIAYVQLEETGDLHYNEGGCPPGFLSVVVDLEVATADGRLAELWSAELRGSVDRQISVRRELSEVNGTLDLESFVDDPGRYDVIRYYFSLGIANERGAVLGRITGEGQWQQGDATDPFEAVGSQGFLVGDFEAEPVAAP